MLNYIKVKYGLDILLREDGYLLEKNVSERAVTHKLAEHLQKIFPEWNVDCEYNRNINREKSISKENVRVLLVDMANYLQESFPENRTVADDEIYTKEEINDLKKQLENPEKIQYIESLDLYLFLLEIDGEKFPQPVYPDIIIHHRGTKNNNIIIEAKKTGGKRKEMLYDLVKLAIFTSSKDYNYNDGIFIELPVEEKFHRFSYFKKEKTYLNKVCKILPVIRRS